MPKGATVTIRFIGVTCSTGRVFESNFHRLQPTTIALDDIPAWRSALPGTQVGGRRLIVAPPSAADGDRGRAPLVAPGETLWYVVEVVSFVAA